MTDQVQPQTGPIDISERVDPERVVAAYEQRLASSTKQVIVLEAFANQVHEENAGLRSHVRDLETQLQELQSQLAAKAE